jgi:mannan polymerase II complex MNN10 subunit
MLVKSLRASPSILLFLVFCALFGWHLSKGTESNIEVIPGPAPPPPPPPPPEAEQPKPEPPKPAEPAPAPAPPKEPPKPKQPRVAVVTFVTDQRSYLHLSLKNKDRMAPVVGFRRQDTDTSIQTMHAVISTISSSITSPTRTMHTVQPGGSIT